MSAYGLTLTLLATGLAEAVAKDELPEAGGFDLGAGLFGPNVSAWLRTVADELAATQARETVLRGLVTRYRTETPLGHQPHMIAHYVDEVLEVKP